MLDLRLAITGKRFAVLSSLSNRANIIYGKGISKESSLLELALKFDIIQKSGSWFSYNDERLAQGKEAVKALLEQNKELYAEIEKKVKAEAVEKTDLIDIDEGSDDEDNGGSEE